MTYSAIHLVAYSQLGYKYIEFWNYKDKKLEYKFSHIVVIITFNN